MEPIIYYSFHKGSEINIRPQTKDFYFKINSFMVILQNMPKMVIFVKLHPNLIFYKTTITQSSRIRS